MVRKTLFVTHRSVLAHSSGVVQIDRTKDNVVQYGDNIWTCFSFPIINDKKKASHVGDENQEKYKSR